MLDNDIVRVFLLLAVFASVFLLLQVVFRATADTTVHLNAINKRLRMIRQGTKREDVIAELRRNDPLRDVQGEGFFVGLNRKFRQMLMMADVPFGPGQVMLGMAVVFLVLTILIALFASLANFPLSFGVMQLVLAVAAAFSIGIPLFILSFLAHRRRKRMQDQFPVALDIFVRALRSGHPVSAAIELLTEEMEDPIGSQFGLVADEVSYGADLTAALQSMAERWDMDDIRMFVVSLSLQNETGGNLAEILENLSDVIRERASLYMKVRALSSEGRMTGWILGVLPIVLFVMLFMMNPPFYLDVALDPIFFIGFPLLIAWYLFGIYMIRRLIDLKV
ncbi:type II secretion system F family protein [Altererythrobacter sp. MF3-039]|uniref:type II secretion system F family protein n=1 Tax=Altererythrobacter sp. MF3-039 TaxID=3252901 RepID=UPI00390C6C59